MSTEAGGRRASGPSEAGKPGNSDKADKASRYRGGAFDQLDIPALTSFLLCSLLFVLALVGVKSLDYSSLEHKTLDDLPERVAKIIMPLKMPGKPVEKVPKAGQGRGAVTGISPGAGDQGAAARIERSKRTVSEQIGQARERITKAAVLSILSGTGPGTQKASGGRPARGRGFADFGSLDDKLANLEGLTKFDDNDHSSDRSELSSSSKGEAIGTTAGIDKLVKGFQNAKMDALKIGVMELEKPELMERNDARFTGNRNPQDVAAFISKQQQMVAMLYAERLKVNPALEGKITVVMVIEEDGRVSSATALRAETTMDDLDFQEDLLRRIKKWIFPPSTGGPVQMKSPFVFKPA